MPKPLLKKIAERVLGPIYADMVWKRIEIIGDIAIIRKPFDMSVDVFKAIGEELIKELPYVRSVWLSVSPVHGIERIREYIHLAGEKRRETVYKEYGCSFKLDITKVYVSPVLGYDRIRIAKQVRKGEEILNMFAGYCPYSIIISKHSSPSYVLSIDINQYAVKYARINIELNKVSHINEIVHGDALIVVPSLEKKFDRVLMPYPDLFETAIAIAIEAVKNYGIIHPHLFVEADSKKNTLISAYNIVTERLHKLGVSAEVLGGHVIRGVAPRKYHVVVDVRVVKGL